MAFDIVALPDIGSEITFRILSPPKYYSDIYRDHGMIGFLCDILNNGDSDNIGNDKGGGDNLMIINSSVYKGMIAQLRKYNITIDSYLKCLTEKAWTVECKSCDCKNFIRNLDGGSNSNSKVYRVTLRKDLEQLV